MAKKRPKPRAAVCTYCGIAVAGGSVTIDHVSSRRWYPPSTPSTIARWKVPACDRCNNRKSRFEQQMFVRLALCADPTNPAAHGMYDRAKRAIDPDAASDVLERSKRRRLREQIMSEMQQVAQLPGEGILPSFVGNFAQGSRTAIVFKTHLLDELVNLWARGVHRVAWGDCVVSGAEIEHLQLTDEVAAKAFEETQGRWKILDGGPGVQVSVLPGAGDGHRVTIYAFLIWNQFRAYAIVQERVSPDYALAG